MERGERFFYAYMQVHRQSVQQCVLIHILWIFDTVFHATSYMADKIAFKNNLQLASPLLWRKIFNTLNLYEIYSKWNYEILFYSMLIFPIKCDCLMIYLPIFYHGMEGYGGLVLFSAIFAVDKSLHSDSTEKWASMSNLPADPTECYFYFCLSELKTVTSISS